MPKQPGLPLKTLEGLLVGHRFGWQELECHVPAEAGVLGIEYDTHAPSAYLLKNAVVRNRAADQGG